MLHCGIRALTLRPVALISLATITKNFSRERHPQLMEVSNETQYDERP